MLSSSSGAPNIVPAQQQQQQQQQQQPLRQQSLGPVWMKRWTKLWQVAGGSTRVCRLQLKCSLLQQAW
jgi:hypothetical protein